MYYLQRDIPECSIFESRHALVSPCGTIVQTFAQSSRMHHQPAYTLPFVTSIYQGYERLHFYGQFSSSGLGGHNLRFIEVLRVFGRRGLPDGP